MLNSWLRAFNVTISHLVHASLLTGASHIPEELSEQSRLQPVFGCSYSLRDLHNPKNIIVLLLLFLFGGQALGQTPDSLNGRTKYGMQVLLTNSGFGLGGYMSRDISDRHALTAELSISAAKDEREVAFFDRFGQRDVPNKANYLLEIPLLVGGEKRLFEDKIEDNFRPFISASVGPLLGWVYPYFDDDNNNGVLDEGESTHDVLSGVTNGHIQPGFASSLAIGARFGEPGASGYGVRIGYRFSYYLDEIALLEQSIRAPSRRLGTPLVVVYFGRFGN